VLVTGTCFEYGLASGALAEQLPTAPVSAYALAKDTLRKMLQALQASEQFTLQWARLFYMHGPGQNANSLLSQLDRAIDAGAGHFDMSGGEQLRDYLPVQAVALRLAALLGQPACEGVVNVCSGEPISVRRLVEQHIAARGSAIQPRLGVYPYPDIEPMAFWGDGGKFAAQVGVQ
jgi:dTDP-6-deoxy-L-talose 4-dehydrogenase (NAD+)